MLNVWSILWGDKYSPQYAYILRGMVERHLSVPHRFRCITDHDLPGIETVKPQCAFPGWWQKIQLFKPGLCEGRNLWLDLDVVVVGSLDWAAEIEGDLCAAWNWAQSGHGGIQSSVMVWTEMPEIWEMFNTKAMGRLWGDQEWITELRDTGVIDVTRIPDPLVRSYKYHCRAGVPDGCSVVCFHGKPDPHQVNDAWVRESTSTAA